MTNYLLALGVAATGAAALHVFALSQQGRLVSLGNLFLLAQWVTLVGALRIVDIRETVHVEYVEILTYTVIAFAIASGILNEHRAAARKVTMPRIVHAVELTPLVTAGLALSIMVTVWYFNAVGHLPLVEGLGGILSGSEADVATLRLESYSGKQYFAPGFVNQFKNVLLPALSLMVTYTLFTTRAKFRWLISLALGALSVMALIGTGQRAQFILFLLVIAVFGLLASVGNNSWRLAVAATAAAVPVLLIVTMVLGRVVVEQDTPSVIGLLGQIWDRIVFVNQHSGLVAFEYTSALPTQWGAEWVRSLVGALPGRSDPGLAAEVFKVLYGTTRGTAPPSMMGSVHHNFGIVGVISAPWIYAYVFFRITELIERADRTSALALVGMAGVIVVCGTWIAGDPTSLLNNGLVVYVLLWIAGSRMTRAAGWLPAKAEPIFRNS